MKSFQKIMLTALPAAILVSSCVKEKDFPDTPVIAFRQYVTYGTDSANCFITFKDGDGDIGIQHEDASSPNDLVMTYYYKDPVDGQYKLYDADGNPANGIQSPPYSYRIPNLTPDGQFKAIEGEILIKLRAQPIYGPGHHDVKFEIQLRDRAGHLSNKVSTNEIHIP
ncbi:MAG: hypothetical protein ACJ77K_17790 [Bacteroidia bacterium]